MRAGWRWLGRSANGCRGEAWVEENGCPDYVSFDNDLGPLEPEGRHFVEWLIQRDLDRGDMPEHFDFFTHSQWLFVDVTRGLPE